MADEVKLITFAGETVSPLYDGLMQELYTGGGGVITGAVVTIKDASNLHITGGYGALCGREFEIFASDIPVTLSSSGTLKGRLYLHMDLAQSGAPIELLVEVASSLTPVVQDADVNTTNGVYEVNLATFDVGTSAISNLADVSPKLSKIPDQISLLNSACANRVGYIDTTSAAITTITTYNADWTATEDVWCIGFCRKNSAGSNNPQVFLDSITMANCSSIENTFFQFPVKKGQHIKTRNDSGGTYSITVYKML